MAQEGITNAVKHASDAGGILVELACAADGVVLRVSDDDPHGRLPESETGVQGLRSLRRRVEAAGGDLRIGSRLRGGRGRRSGPRGRSRLRLRRRPHGCAHAAYGRDRGHALARLQPRVRVLVLTTFDLDDYVVEALVLAESTVKTHINQLLRRLSTRDRTGLIVLAYETGLIRLMFGMSMRFVSDSALRRGASPGKVVGGRMIDLLAIGLLHSLVYPGEVLKEYAVAGLLMLPIALKAPRLLAAAVALAVATVPALIAQTHEDGDPRFGYVGGITGGVQAMLYICLMALACSCRIRKPLIAFFEPLGRMARPAMRVPASSWLPSAWRCTGRRAATSRRSWPWPHWC